MSASAAVQGNSPRKVAIASLVGTAIEFYDYYIYAAAAVLVFNSQFFPKGDPSAATLLSLSTLALAFLARPIGSALFGHFGDRIGRIRQSLVSPKRLKGPRARAALGEARTPDRGAASS